MYVPRIVAMSGSRRRESFNARVLAIAVAAARSENAEVTVVDWDELPLPLYDQDEETEQGLPENALKLQDMMVEADGLLIAAPEYNSSITPLLKNAIDWTSRGAPPLKAFRGKTAALMSASPGGLGGLRGLVHVRAILGNIGVLVLPEQLAISRAGEAFDDDGNLKDEKQQQAIEKLGRTLVDTLRRLHGPPVN